MPFVRPTAVFSSAPCLLLGHRARAGCGRSSCPPGAGGSRRARRGLPAAALKSGRRARGAGRRRPAACGPGLRGPALGSTSRRGAGAGFPGERPTAGLRPGAGSAPPEPGRRRPSDTPSRLQPGIPEPRSAGLPHPQLARRARAHRRASRAGAGARATTAGAASGGRAASEPHGGGGQPGGVRLSTRLDNSGPADRRHGPGLLLRDRRDVAHNGCTCPGSRSPQSVGHGRGRKALFSERSPR